MIDGNNGVLNQELPVPIAWMSPSETILDCNNALSQLLGYPRSALIGASLAQYFLIPSQSRRVHELTLSLGGVKNQELSLRSQIGKEILVSVTTQVRSSPRGKTIGYFAVLYDVTDYGQAEAALQQSEARYRELVESQGEGIGIVDPEERFVFANPAAEAIFGVLPGTLVGRYLYDLVEPEQMAIVKRQSALRKQGQRSTYELEIKHPDGERRSIQVTGTPQFKVDGRWFGTFGIFADITERKKAEAALRTSEEKFRTVFMKTTTGMCLTGTDGRFLSANDALCRMLGYTAEELAATDFAAITHPDDLAASREYARNLIAGEQNTCHFEKRYLAKNGKIVWAEVSIFLLHAPTGEPLYFVTNIHDVTQRREAEAALHESEEKYRNLVERASDGIVIIQDMIVRFANPRFAQMLGYSVPDITGTVFLDHVHSDEQSKVANYYRRRMAGETVASDYETVLQRKDGSKLPVELNGGVITYQGESADLKIIRDITERKKAEQEIKAYAKHLERLNRTLNQQQKQLQEQAAVLAQANQELKRMSEAKSEFVAAVSHDLRTPLTTIIESISLAEDGTLGPLTDEQRKFFRYAREEAQGLEELINNLLDAAKIEQGKIEVKPTPINVAEQLQQVKITYEPLAREKSLEIAIELPEPPVFVLCDASHYHRVLINLVSNAIKFTSSAGRIILRAEPVPDSMVRTIIQDTGNGIPKNQHDRIFQKFEQVHQDRSSPQPGTGLGLALCKQLVELNKGTIGFESEEHRGSTFFFLLPMYPADQFHRN